MRWTVEEPCFDKTRITTNGNKFIIGNGYMGYRGTLEEYSKDELVACNLAGVYDKVGDMWREPVNAPNGLFTKLYCDGIPLSVLSCKVSEHNQSLNISNATHSRRTIFTLPDGNTISVSSERFISMEDIHLICMKYTFSTTKDCKISIETGIDGDVWDINGPHLEEFVCDVKENVLVMSALTYELKYPVVVAEGIDFSLGSQEIVKSDKAVMRNIIIDCKAGNEYKFTKYVSIYTGIDDAGDPVEAAMDACNRSLRESYETLSDRHERIWKEKWNNSDVQIEGDNEAQFALRYSIYHLLIIAPSHTDKTSIPARGLSGQVYKGAIFWDTEMFMLPFFIYTNPSLARNLMMYRYNTLEGARRKAAEYGYRGAFYAWESQDTGDDACTLFNITDVFTNRPMRTFFRDKQIHISGDVAYGIWQYYCITGDESVLLDGGAEVILECARFFYSYSYFKTDKNRYELLDVTGPDEYHERVNNNAFTNAMVKYTLEVAIETLNLLREKHYDRYIQLVSKINFHDDIDNIKRMNELLYVPAPNPETSIIEQFDGYNRLEDVSLQELKGRILNKNEYLGGGNGIATTTQILKQADVVLMLNLFKNKYSDEIKKLNWDYYEPRTEHGSSLSPCVYAMVASYIGYTEWAYNYFKRTATIDLTGDSKQYVGNLYIGGTHPAANGGAWMAAVLGFAGMDFDGEKITMNPSLPSEWESVKFNLFIKGQRCTIEINKTNVVVCTENNKAEINFEICGQLINCKEGQKVSTFYKGE